ncbi:MAG: Gmad2 immunoglobulin-like domain-containing protein [Acidimicrobiales bacterium]
MSAERDLRDALRSRAAAVPVGRADEAGLGRRLAVAHRRRRAKAGGGALALLVALGALSVVARAEGDQPNVVTGPGPSTTSTTGPEPSTSTVVDLMTTTLVAPAPTSTGPVTPPATGPGTTRLQTTSTRAALPPLPDEAVWPPAGSTTSFATPAAAAADFARRFLAMGTPQLAAARVTGNDATVDVRATANGGPTTVIALRRTPARGWVVVGCATADIRIDAPAVGTNISSPLTVRGQARAFEGQVDVEVRGDGALTPIGRSIGMGGGTDVMPFESTITFTRPAAGRGTVTVSQARADVADQGPLSATVIRVAF